MLWHVRHDVVVIIIFCIFICANIQSNRHNSTTFLNKYWFNCSKCKQSLRVYIFYITSSTKSHKCLRHCIDTRNLVVAKILSNRVKISVFEALQYKLKLCTCTFIRTLFDMNDQWNWNCKFQLVTKWKRKETLCLSHI